LKKIKIAFIIILTAVAVGFFAFNETTAVEKKYDASILTVEKKTETKESSVELINKGQMVASWYGPKFHGKYTANGEVYNQMALTAAHKTLPFDTMLRITNPKNGKSVVVRINDRGPYIQGRNIDLSKGAAIALGMLNKGVQKVKVQELVLKSISRPLVRVN
jgi:rare lipoprotein A